MPASTEQIKELRERTGAGIMDCKRALDEAGSDLTSAEKLLKEWGLAGVHKKAGREANQGLIESYIHAGGRIGALVEVNCETDFVARTDDFKAMAKDLAMQIAAMNPRYISREDVPRETVEHELEIYRTQAKNEKKPEQVVDKVAT